MHTGLVWLLHSSGQSKRIIIWSDVIIIAFHPWIKHLSSLAFQSSCCLLHYPNFLGVCLFYELARIVNHLLFYSLIIFAAKTIPPEYIYHLTYPFIIIRSSYQTLPVDAVKLLAKKSALWAVRTCPQGLWLVAICRCLQNFLPTLPRLR